MYDSREDSSIFAIEILFIFTTKKNRPTSLDFGIRGVRSTTSQKYKNPTKFGVLPNLYEKSLSKKIIKEILCNCVFSTKKTLGDFLVENFPISSNRNVPKNVLKTPNLYEKSLSKKIINEILCNFVFSKKKKR